MLAALAGVGLFYVVLSSGDTGELSDYERQQPGVEKLVDRSGDPVEVAGREAGRNAEGKKVIDVSGRPTTAGPLPVIDDPVAAAAWREKRKAARERDQLNVEAQLREFFAEAEIPQESQERITELFASNQAKRESITADIESGKLSPRVGRQEMSKQREGMKRAVIDELGTENYEQVRLRMDKIRVVVF